MSLLSEYDFDLASAMEKVARHLLGEPNAALSSKDELRFGNRGSVSVKLTGEKRGTYFDYEAGEGGGVLKLISTRRGLVNGEAWELMREIGVNIAPLHAKRPPSKQIVAAYDYTDELGRLLFQVIRYEPKDFRQRGPDGDGWTWKTAGVRRVLYRLPQIMEAVRSGRTVYIVEGEKAALALVAIGLDATCSPGGAGKWRPDYGTPLTGADVVVLPDNDPQAVDSKTGEPRWHPDGRPVLPGQDHAADVARHLTGIARRVRVIELPGLPLKGDVVDWIAAGGTWQALEALCDAVADEPAQPPINAIADYLSAEAWAEREFPPSVRLLGDLVTTTTRAFLIGATGLGKTMLGVALAAGMATGTGFLDWRYDRPVRVLYVDGEMPAELVRSRVRDAMRRLQRTDLAGNLFIYAADSADAFASLFPSLGGIQPLNTEAGQNFLYALVKAIGGVDCIIFDNVMSLVAGDQKDEIPWSHTLPLVSGLTRLQIGQIWLDHAGHNTARQYGSSTKAWRFDAVGIMTELPEDQRRERDLAFKLSFDAPGKARRRTPDNWREFAPRTIRLADDIWTVDGNDDSGATVAARGKVSPSRARYHAALLDALISASTAPGTTTMHAWETECIRKGFVDAPTIDDAASANRSRLAKFRTARSELVAAGWIGVDGARVSDLTTKYNQFGSSKQ